MYSCTRNYAHRQCYVVFCCGWFTNGIYILPTYITGIYPSVNGAILKKTHSKVPRIDANKTLIWRESVDRGLLNEDVFAI